MTQREYKRLLFFLRSLAFFLEKAEASILSEDLLKTYNDDELNELLGWHRGEKHRRIENRDLLERAVGSNYLLLIWTIKKLEEQNNTFLSYSQDKVHSFFRQTQNEIHYLASKPVTEWDEYDRANYRSLTKKSGRSKKVYGIFTSDVLKEDVYAVTTKPSYFFDTKKEAEDEITSIVSESKFTEDDLVIHSLWLLNQN